MRQIPADMNNGWAADRLLELMLVALVACGLGGLLLSVVGIFKAPQAFVFGLGVTALYARLTRNREGVPEPACASGWHLAALVLFALFFRLPPINYVSGGQDQGVYVNIAAHVVHTGGIAFDDRVSGRIKDPATAATYRAENAAVNGDFLPGLFERDGQAVPRFQFQFYHLFPVYMATVGGLFGLDASVYALTLLAVLSVLYVYALTLALTGRRKVALAAALLLAVNPLHAFFSRFPVTEVAELCFTAAAAWLLVAGWQQARVSGRVRWPGLLLSVAALACAFLVRMSGFMYIPTILLIGTVAAIHESNAAARRVVLVWALLANAAYAASVVYGDLYSTVYARWELNSAFGRMLGPHWRPIVLALWAAGILVMVGLHALDFQHAHVQRLRRALERSGRWLGLVAIAALAIGLYKLYTLGWTDRYAADPWFAQRWQIAGTHLRVFRYSSVVVAAEYTGILIPILFLLLAFSRRLPGVLVVLLAFVLMFLIYLVGPQWLVPYQPYYARYLVSEFVPYMIVFVVAAVPFIAGRVARRAAIAALVASAAYAAILSVGQLRANEQHGMAASYDRIASRIGDDDLLLLDMASLPLPYQLVEMPFVLRYDRDVARITAHGLADVHYLNGLQRDYDRLFLLSGSAAPPPGFVPVDSVRFREWVADQGVHPPIRSAVRFAGRTYLYMRPGASIVVGEAVKVGSLGGASSSNEWNAMFTRGWSIPEAWGMWSDGSEAQIAVPVTLVDGQRPALLTLEVQPFTTPSHPRQHVEINVDGAPVYAGDLGTVTTLRIPLSKRPATRETRYIVTLALPDAATPREAGSPSGDPRRLAIGLLSIRLDDSTGADRVPVPIR